MRKILVIIAALAAVLAVANTASAASASGSQSKASRSAQGFTDTYLYVSAGQQDNGHAWVDWHADIGNYWNKAGVLLVEVATSPQFSESEGFYEENIVDDAYLDSYANPGSWLSSLKLPPDDYYVAALLQWERNTYDDFDWTDRWVTRPDMSFTVATPAITWNTCSNAIWVTNDQWDLKNGHFSCRKQPGKFQVTYRFKTHGQKQAHIFGVRLTGQHEGTARYLRTGAIGRHALASWHRPASGHARRPRPLRPLPALAALCLADGRAGQPPHAADPQRAGLTDDAPERPAHAGSRRAF